MTSTVITINGGAATDSQASRRIPAASKTVGSVPPIDISGIQNLLHGVVLDHEDATNALNKLVQRALRALPFVKLDQLREVLDRFELCVQLLEQHVPESEIEKRLTPGSKVSRLKHDTLHKLAMRDDGVNPTLTAVTRVVIPDHRLPNNGLTALTAAVTIGSGELIGTPPSAVGHNKGPNSFQARAAAAVNSLASAALIGSSKPPPDSVSSPLTPLATNNLILAAGGKLTDDGSFVSPREAPLPPFVPTPLPIAPVPANQITKDYDSPSMARRTLAGVKLGGGTGPGGNGTPPAPTVAPGVIAANAAAASSRATVAQMRKTSSTETDESGKDDTTHRDIKEQPTAPAAAGSTRLGLGLHSGGAGAAKPHNKFLDKVRPGGAARPQQSENKAAAAPAPAAGESPNLSGRRIGKAGAGGTGHGRSASATQSILLTAAVVSAKRPAATTNTSPNAPTEDEKSLDADMPALTDVIEPTSLNTGVPLTRSNPVPAGLSAPAPTPTQTPAPLTITEPATEATRAQLQALLNRALRLVPSYKFSPATFRTLHAQFETAVAFMEERCSNAGAAPPH